MFLLLGITHIDSASDHIFLTDLYESFYSLMLSTALPVCGSRELAEDAIQDSVVRLIGKLDTLRGLVRPALAVYVTKTVKSVALNSVSRDERKRYYDWDSLPDQISTSETPETAILRTESLRYLGKAISQLCERDMDLLYFKYILGLSNEELAETMGVKRDRVSDLIYRARQRAFCKLEAMGYGR